MQDLRPFGPTILTRRPQQTHLRRKITVTNNEASEISEFEIPIEIGSDQADLRHKLKTGSARFIVDGLDAPFWPIWGYDGKLKLFVPMTIAASSTKDAWLHYGGYVQPKWTGDDVFWFFDDFPGDTVDGNKWDAETIIGGSGAGTYVVADSCLKVTPGGAGAVRLVKTTYVPGTAQNYALEMRAKIHSVNGYPDWGITYRYVDTNNWYNWNFCYYDNAYDKVGITRRLTGGYADLGGDVVTTEAGTWADLKMVKVGNNHDGYVNAVKHSNSTDSSHTQGRVGITYDDEYGGNGTFWVDWFLVRKATANMPSASIGSEELVIRRW